MAAVDPFRREVDVVHFTTAAMGLYDAIYYSPAEDVQALPPKVLSAFGRMQHALECLDHPLLTVTTPQTPAEGTSVDG